MLSQALQKANTAVLLDKAANFKGALEAYTDACKLIQSVMLRSNGGDDEKLKLEEIRNTYMIRINELESMGFSLLDFEEEALSELPLKFLHGSANHGAHVDSRRSYGNPQPIKSFDSPDSAQVMQYTDERGGKDKRRAEEEQNSEEERRAGWDLVRHYSMDDDAKPQEILPRHEGKGEPGYLLEEKRPEPELSHQIDVNDEKDQQERLSRAVNKHLEEIKASQERTRQLYLEKEEHWNVFNMLDDNFSATTGSGSTKLKEPSAGDDSDQTLSPEPARKKTRGFSGGIYDSDDKRKLIYQHDDTQVKPSEGQDLVTSEPLSQVPEEPGPSSLTSPSKSPSRKENTKGKAPSRDAPTTPAQFDQAFEEHFEPGASLIVQDSNNPFPNLPPLADSVEKGLSRSRPTSNMASKRSPEQVHETRMLGEEFEGFTPVEPYKPSGQTLEDRPSSPTQPSTSASKNSKKWLRQFLKRTRRS
ncbi:uncharacterized protein N7483_011976 [Penicillium malachiteum]|uniref:uncharacterized protein n=1 Tax=Penicillium malachiteum TaxID=1324776 RepID=UPI0025486AF4|nr:uncharacterized protein N7483_011976 [Penicillium malachiteum]KAJ5714795.1 hypothetical protein N7483_011976 [Penicillium malachiteum]